jgi:hypothetical protein
MYYWLFKHSQTSPVCLWMWRKYIGILSLIKHLRRRNYKQSYCYIKFLFNFK